MSGDIGGAFVSIPDRQYCLKLTGVCVGKSNFLKTTSVLITLRSLVLHFRCGFHLV